MFFLRLPLAKLSGLVVKMFTKPVAMVIKARAKVHPGLHDVCHSLGLKQHRMYIVFHMGFRGVQNYNIKPPLEERAVEKGADLMSEMIIFSAAVAVATNEYARNAAKTKENKRIAEEARCKAERELEERFRKLEMQDEWLKAKLAELGHDVERDLDEWIREADAACDVSLG